MKATETKVQKKQPAETIRKVMSASYLWQGENQVPKIQMSGKYLQDAGFPIGTALEVNISHGKITITAKKIFG